MPDLPVSSELFAIASEAIAYALHMATGKEPFQPAIVAESADGARHLTQLVLVKTDDTLCDARRILNQNDDALRAALVLDGALTVSGRSQDAAIVHVGERGAPAHEFAQRYQRKRFGKGVVPVGNIAYAGERAPLFD